MEGSPIAAQLKENPKTCRRQKFLRKGTPPTKAPQKGHQGGKKKRHEKPTALERDRLGQPKEGLKRGTKVARQAPKRRQPATPRGRASAR